MTLTGNWRRRFGLFAGADVSLLESLKVTTSVPIRLGIAAERRLRQLRAEGKA